MVKRVIVASHRGFCAGVERAVETVERALDIYGPPVYVRKQIVHNTHVVRNLEARGAIFVESTADVPREGRLILAAHGVAPEVHSFPSRCVAYLLCRRHPFRVLPSPSEARR